MGLGFISQPGLTQPADHQQDCGSNVDLSKRYFRCMVLEMTDRSSYRSSDYSEWLSASD
jgi:hypothetical protein